MPNVPVISPYQTEYGAPGLTNDEEGMSIAGGSHLPGRDFAAGSHLPSRDFAAGSHLPSRDFAAGSHLPGRDFAGVDGNTTSVAVYPPSLFDPTGPSIFLNGKWLKAVDVGAFSIRLPNGNIQMWQVAADKAEIVPQSRYNPMTNAISGLLGGWWSVADSDHGIYIKLYDGTVVSPDRISMSIAPPDMSAPKAPKAGPPLATAGAFFAGPRIPPGSNMAIPAFNGNTGQFASPYGGGGYGYGNGGGYGYGGGYGWQAQQAALAQAQYGYGNGGGGGSLMAGEAGKVVVSPWSAFEELE